MTRRAYIVAVVLPSLIKRFNLRSGADAHKWVMAARLPNGSQVFYEVRNDEWKEIARFYTECDPFPLSGDAVQVAVPVEPVKEELRPGLIVLFNRQPFRKIEHGKQP